MSNFIDPTCTRLCHRNALHMIRCASLAYKNLNDEQRSPDTVTIARELNRLTGEHPDVVGYSNASTQAILIEHSECYVIAFRGTDQVLDWKHNLWGSPVDAYGGRMRRGFLEAFKDVWDWGLEAEWVRRKNISPKPTFLTGHSLGAALATVCAARLLNEQIPFMSLYTFGSPRVFSRDYARVFNADVGARCHRFQNNTDIVTRVPARLMGYAHAGHCIYIDEDGIIQDDPGFWARFTDIVEARVDLISKLRLSDFPDHGHLEYLHHIEAWKVDQTLVV